MNDSTRLILWTVASLAMFAWIFVRDWQIAFAIWLIIWANNEQMKHNISVRYERKK